MYEAKTWAVKRTQEKKFAHKMKKGEYAGKW